MESAGFGDGPGALFQEIGDVFATEGVQRHRVLESAGDVFVSVNLGQSDDFLDVPAIIQALGLEVSLIFLGLGAESQEALEKGLVASLEALGEQFADMVGMLEVPVAFVAAGMFGHDLLVVQENEFIRISLEGETSPGQPGWTE